MLCNMDRAKIDKEMATNPQLEKMTAGGRIALFLGLDIEDGCAAEAYYQSERAREKCSKCICKTCAIAAINGGAPGCGDCIDCMSRNYELQYTNCNDYYNPAPIKVSTSYLLDKAEEIKDERRSRL